MDFLPKKRMNAPMVVQPLDFGFIGAAVSGCKSVQNPLSQCDMPSSQVSNAKNITSCMVGCF